MTSKKALFLFAPVLVLVGLAGGLQKNAPGLTPIEDLGKKLFFDANLSNPPGQACSACHDPKTGWTGSLENQTGIYEGAVSGRFGNRRPPSAAYAGNSPVLYQNKDGEFVGGMFWDGRATGRDGRDPLAEQAGGPFLNPLEHNLPDRKAAVRIVRASAYAGDFARIWKLNPSDWDQKTDQIFEDICRSIAAFERSAEVNPFDSKFDSFWRAARARSLDPAKIEEKNAGKFSGLGLNEREIRGLVLFAGKGKCAVCHALDPGPKGEPPVFTDYKYDNLGLPKNTANPFYRMGPPFNPDGRDWIDEGLGGYFKTDRAHASEVKTSLGKFKVPTLRNVDLRPSPGFVKVFGHNGYFKSLEDIVHFYNVRDLGAYPPPEVRDNMNTEEMGNLGLKSDEEAALVAFLKTLTDGSGSARK